MIRMEYIFSFFLPQNKSISDYESVSYVIRKHLNDIGFVSPSTYIPLPLDAPDEIPRMQMIREDQSVKMTFSKMKIDIAMNDSFLSLNHFLKLGTTRVFFEKVLNILSNELNFNFERVAVISRSFIKVNEPEKYLSSRILKVSENIKNISLSYSTEEDLDGVKLNVIKEYQTGFINETREKILIVVQEVNNNPERNLLSGEVMMSIYDYSADKIDNFTL